MSDNLYNEQILELAAGLVKADRLEKPDVSASVTSPLCGSRMKVDLTLSDHEGEPVIMGYGHDVRACALGQASAALMRDLVRGKTLTEVAVAGAQIRAMLKEGRPAPEGAWNGYAILQPARDHRSRHAAILLPFDAIKKAGEARSSSADDES